jgi:hypothetical protein
MVELRPGLSHADRSAPVYAGIILVSLVVLATMLALMGRIAWCECGFGWWTSDAYSSETSQHLADPYSFSHILHGMIFYGMLAWLAPSWRMTSRFAVAVAIELAWEVLENSPMVIERYREQTAALGYTGDSILNSLGDMLSCMLGFWIALRLPARWTWALAVAEELAMLVWIRDNLTLNVVMLIVPLDAVKQWQAGQ